MSCMLLSLCLVTRSQTSSGNRSDSEFKVRNQSRIGYSRVYESWVGAFYMSSVMANCVRRSNALCSYSRSLTYAAVLIHSSQLVLMVASDIARRAFFLA
jgi:hypothetical protein